MLELQMPPPSSVHVERVRTALVAKYGSLWRAADRLTFGSMSGAQLLTHLRQGSLCAGLNHNIHAEIGLHPLGEAT